MPANISKSRQQRFWNTWRQAGAIAPASAFAIQFVTSPPPIPAVTKMIARIIGKLNLVHARTEKQLSCADNQTHPTHRCLTILRSEVIDARYQVSLCEYLIAKEYLRCSLSVADANAKRRLKRIVRLLDWCVENDRRGSYKWIPVAMQRAA